MIATKQRLVREVPTIKQIFFKMFLLRLLVQLMFVNQALCSGVLEFELVNLRLLEAPAYTTSQNGDPFRLTVCLKEAFASQLDGPCAYGNTSITLDNLESTSLSKLNRLAKSKTWPGSEREVLARGEPAENQVPQMTSIVRIPFSFRWTKSFTIVLTAEHQAANSTPPADNLEQVTTARPLKEDPAATRSRSEAQLVAAPASNGLALIDRHVLTENEVLPSRDGGNKAAWTTRFSRSFKTSLVYRFRIVCASNYYGDDCETFCRPRDDQFGHVQCTPTGQKICLEGWQGPDCAQPKCRAGCNKQHGFCDTPDTCQCRSGWTGARCDECLTYPGCQNGYCLAPWQCVCQPNWAGVLCDQDLNYCASHAPCENDGICLNVAPGRYKCQCPIGFTGLNCQMKLATLVEPASLPILSTRLHAAGCGQNPCLNGGLCLRVGQHLVTSTTTSTTTASTTSLDLDPREMDETQASIQVASQPYRCQCPAGFTGDYCQWADIPIGKVNESNILPLDMEISSPNSKEESVDQKSVDSTQTPEVNKDVDISQDELSLADRPEEFLFQPVRPTPHMEMRHLISGVVVSSAIGVFCAALLLAWCCLMAIKSGKFQLIQMNLVRNPTDLEADGNYGTGFASSLRRVQAKIRDSFRRSNKASIKPETKLSLDNVLNPARMAPPSYEESNQEADLRIESQFEVPTKSRPQYAVVESVGQNDDDHLVKRGALERQLAMKKKSNQQYSSSQFTHEPARCPKHGHLYRQTQPQLNASTTIEIEYQPANTHT